MDEDFDISELVWDYIYDYWADLTHNKTIENQLHSYTRLLETFQKKKILTEKEVEYIIKGE